MTTLTPPINSPARPQGAFLVRTLLAAALALAGVLLLANLPFVPARTHAYVSALPLALAGIGYAILQFRTKPPLATLLKRLLLAATFVLWAIDQLLPSGWLATFLGDVVIGAYVLDLYWLIQEQMAAVPSTAPSRAQSA